jgi:hypothetical protein
MEGLAQPFLEKQDMPRGPTKQAPAAEQSLARAATKWAEYSNLLNHTLGTTLCPNRKATSHKIQE